MVKLTRDALLKRPFSDLRFYPYGFSRSGDFSISESNLLAQYGTLIAALVDGELIPETAAEQGYIDVALGRKKPGDAIEKVWAKYQQRINRPKPDSVYGSKPLTEGPQPAGSSTDPDTCEDIPLLNIQVDES
ncbi:DUF413 domain-containing protein [Salinimonas marina]|uniref:Macrodomain Ori protein n=1 Tax=Salinimonas marina TaxID=2785918 RepID=A0A7S9DX02_9ALTE|nr:DUF413 domain-containing protein [Salinimonas marina]QPG05387.1 DUF413 domain-containing protein [Salinimonas marina]